MNISKYFTVESCNVEDAYRAGSSDYDEIIRPRMTIFFVAANELPTLLPDAAKDLIHLGSGSDASFNYMPEVIYASKTRNRFAYDEFYYRTYRDATILTDPTGLKQEWKGTKDQLRDYMSYFPQISVNHTQVPSVNLAILVNGKLFYDDRAVDGCDEYPFIPVFGYFDPSISDYRWKIQGIIRNHG